MKTEDALKDRAISKPKNRKYRLGGMDIEDFQVRFRKVFHREMTPEEKKFFHLAERLLRGEEEQEQTTDALWLHPVTDY